MIRRSTDTCYLAGIIRVGVGLVDSGRDELAVRRSPAAEHAVTVAGRLLPVAALLAQLRQLHRDLLTLADQDSEQEVTASALVLLDRVLSEAKNRLPVESTLRQQIEDYISWETVALEEPPPRAAEAAVVVGQALAALEFYEEGESSPDPESEPVLDSFITGDELPPDSPFRLR